MTASPQRARKDPPPPSTKGLKRKRAEAGPVDVDTNSSGNTRPSKRNRNAGSSKSTAPNTVKTAASTSSSCEWFEKAMGQFGSEDLGEVWSRLLEEWRAFEEEEDSFGDNRVLPVKGRPKSVGMWISRARPPTWRPSDPDAKADEEKFKAWWASLQPAWRVVNGRVGKSMNGDWNALRLPGINGIQSIVAALFFWGLSASPKARSRKAWTTAVRECTEVFEQLRRVHSPA
ncbi:hypothetical protein NLJ89_g12358 [Agrocybe chaxingu]|uniref:Uncharacterized protein n=1 Tax=Agrocybe chaxingu TaxID=84603 RepID=A0A9W8MNK1_9AGAR|nr:hypothetical protein NLJ89_g12358 [Agrocybe chaxingu]